MYGTPNVLAATSVTSPGALLYLLKEKLKTAGWTHAGSGDGGSNFSLVTDQITHGGTGANGFNVAKAWWYGTKAGRHIAIQLITITATTGSTASQMRISYSRSDGLDTAACTSIRMPDLLSDGKVLIGGGTTASPTGIKMAHWVTSPLYVIGNADSDGVGAFWFAAISNNSNTDGCFGFMMEETETTEADTDPVVFYVSNQADTTCYGAAAWRDSGALTTATRSRAWYGIGTASVTFAGCFAFTPGSLDGMTGALQLSLYDSAQMISRILWGNDGSPVASKGYGKNVYEIMTTTTSGTGRRQTFTMDTTNDLIRINGYALPWGASPPTSPGTYTNGGTVRLIDSLAAVPGAGTENDGVGPSITLMSPTPGGDLAATLREAWATPITFRVADDSGIRDVVVTCLFAGENEPLLVHDDEGFWGRWDLHGDKVETVDGDLTVQIDFSIWPVGGWRKEIVALKVNGYDLLGNKEVDAGNVVEND